MFINSSRPCQFLIGLFALITVVRWQAVYYSHDTPKFFLLEIGLSLFVLYQLKARNWQLTLPACLFISASAYACVTLLWAPNMFAGVSFIIWLALTGLTLMALLQQFSARQITHLLLNASAVSAGAFCLTYFIDRLAGLPQLVGNFTPIGFINNAGHVMVIWLPCLILAICRTASWIRRMLLVMILFSLVYILMVCAIRSTIIALLISEMLVLALLLCKDRKQALMFMSVSALLLSGAALFTYSDTLQGGRLSAKFNSLQSSFSMSYQPRLNILANSKDMLLEHPLGVGANNFEFVHPRYAKTGTELASPMVNHQSLLKTPHNIFAKLYTELGWPGGTLFALVLLYYLWQAWLGAWIGGLTERWLCVAYSALLINAQFSAVFLTPVSLAFSVLLIAAIHSRSAHPVLWTAQLNKNLFRVAKVSILTCFLTTSGAFFASEVYSKKGLLTLDAAHLTRSVRLNPGNERAWLMLSISHAVHQNEHKRLAAIKQFRALNPENIHGRYAEAQAYHNIGRHTEALKKVQALLALHPHDKRTLALSHQIKSTLGVSGQSTSKSSRYSHKSPNIRNIPPQRPVL
ncbi:O-antigen ligase family protein [Pseudoalteromonas rubra]|uniref:O-antigen ligase-related domain-containing protein n=1 Tax=Pseudoalteromonas rubra TaxID=43658 RepID=A0A0F4QFN5_9GAMM|nr:O-antigen ligase family protein [Pseudoalteromonas rubra]KJZ05497.1 hypothetical protein TW77_22600 [Pseudoalteromonas rubra]